MNHVLIPYQHWGRHVSPSGMMVWEWRDHVPVPGWEDRAPWGKGQRSHCEGHTWETHRSNLEGERERGRASESKDNQFVPSGAYELIRHSFSAHKLPYSGLPSILALTHFEVSPQCLPRNPLSSLPRRPEEELSHTTHTTPAPPAEWKPATWKREREGGKRERGREKGSEEGREVEVHKAVERRTFMIREMMRQGKAKETSTPEKFFWGKKKLG